jgi:multiple antibiotic resistance protein
MEETFNAFLLSIIPIMVAIDAVGVLPLFISLTEQLDPVHRKKVVQNSVLTAFLITISFAFIGQNIFNALGISVADFMIGGGVLLMVFSIFDILRIGDKGIAVSPTIGVVPLGTPLLAGPATLTTTLILIGNYGYIPVIASLMLNLIFAWFIFDKAEIIIRFMGLNGTKAIAKISSLLMAAIAVKMIRTGIFKIIGQ